MTLRTVILISLFYFVLFMPGVVMGQGQANSYTATVSTLPTASTHPGWTVVVTDSATGCSVGGGSNRVTCRSNGTTWEVVGAESLGYTAEDAANKSTTTALGTSDSLYPSQKAVKTYVDTSIAAIPVGTLPAGAAITMQVANDTVTGTTANRFAKLTGAPSKAIITATSDTENAVGVCVSGCGTTSSATIAIIGQVSCQFDGATTAGNYVTISATTAGQCHDAGSAFPTSGAAYGRVLTTNGASGTYTMELMTPDLAFQNAGNGKSKPGGSAFSIQYNSSNQFAGTGPGTSGQVLTSNGAGSAPTFQTSSSGSPGGSDTFVQFNNAGVFGGDTDFRFTSSGTKQLRISAGAEGAPGLSFNGTTTGLYTLGGPAMGFSLSGTAQMTFSTGILNRSGNWFAWTDGTIGGTPDIAIRRDAVNRMGVVNSNNPTDYAEVKARGIISTLNTFLGPGQQFDKTNTTLADVSAMALTVTAGKTYSFEATLFVDADATGGSKYAIAGTATATQVKYHILMICDASNLNVITSRQTALASSAGQAGCTAGLVRIKGMITVNAGGSLVPQFAQNAANGTSSILTMSTFLITQLN